MSSILGLLAILVLVSSGSPPQKEFFNEIVMNSMESCIDISLDGYLLSRCEAVSVSKIDS